MANVHRPALPEYPFESRFLSLPSGERLHYLDEGTGPVLLMLHGNPTWSFYYRHLILGLRGSHRCIAVDHVGCGLSDKPASFSYQVESHADNIARLIDQLGLDDVTLVVHDWGGAIGYHVALQRRATFRRFVVFNSAVFLLPLPRLLTLLRWPVLGPVLVRGFNAMLRGGLLTARGGVMRGAVKAGYLAPYDTWANRIAIMRFVEEIPLEADHHNRKLLAAMEEGLGGLREHPLLVIWGLRDWVFDRRYLAGWRARFPSGEFHELPDASHWLLEEAHPRILPLMRDFLARSG
jgi:haloalkane dehalogenase